MTPEKKLRYDNFYMDIAQRTSEMSYAKKLKVGAVLVKDDSIISHGWNGMPSDMDNTCEDILEDGSMITKSEVLHAEENAIRKVAASSNSTVGSVLYITHSPCVKCARLIHACKISKVVYKDEYRDSYGSELLKNLGVSVEKL